MTSTSTTSYEKLVKTVSDHGDSIDNRLETCWNYQCPRVSYNQLFVQNICVSKVRSIMHNNEKLLQFSKKRSFNKCPVEVILGVHAYLESQSQSQSR